MTNTSKTYILRSTLPSALIEAMAQRDPSLREAAYGPDGPPEDGREDERPDDTLVAWRLSDNMAAVGILHVILALILANGRLMPDRESHPVRPLSSSLLLSLLPLLIRYFSSPIILL